MPFTPAHTAIVLPFIRIRSSVVSATGLIIGSVAPDFEYFFKMSESSSYSHTLLGVLYFNIPVAIVLAYLFHDVIKKNLISNLPVGLQKRFMPMRQFDFPQYFKTHFFVFVISAALGSLSHILWDNFTHNDGYFAQRISFYKEVVIPWDGVRYPLFYGLQHISTWVGMSVLIAYILFMKPDRQMKVTTPSCVYWLLVITVASMVLIARFSFTEERYDLGNFVVSSITALIIGVTAGGFLKRKPAIHG
jgi:hypothetical protein